MREWTMRHHVAGIDNAGVDNAGVVKCEKCAQDKLKVTGCMRDQLTCDINAPPDKRVFYLTFWPFKDIQGH